MSIVINTNVPALMAAHHVRKTRDGLETAMERLSSGSRINSAADDAAGAGIAQRLTAQIRGTDMAIRNTQDAIGVLQVADGAFIEVENMLARAYELAVQLENNSFLTANDTANIVAELDALDDEIAAIATNTKFNDKDLDGATFSFTASADGTSFSSTLPAFLGANTLDSSATATTVLVSMNSVATARGDLGALINRFEYKVNNLSILSANTSAAKSRIMDTDFAAESANVAKFQVLQQAGAAMLAQANASSQYVLTLLQ